MEQGIGQTEQMSNRRKGDGVVARQRVRLPRQRKSLRLDFRLTVYEKLLRLSRASGGGRPDPLVAVIERLVEAANE